MHRHTLEQCFVALTDGHPESSVTVLSPCQQRGVQCCCSEVATHPCTHPESAEAHLLDLPLWSRDRESLTSLFFECQTITAALLTGQWPFAEIPVISLICQFNMGSAAVLHKSVWPKMMSSLNSTFFPYKIPSILSILCHFF